MTSGGSTLLALLRATEPARVVLIDGDREVVLSRADLRALAGGAASVLKRVAAPRTAALLLVARAEDFLAGFWGALAAGLVPVPIALPAGTATRSGDIDRLVGVWRTLGEPVVIVDPRFAEGIRALAETSGLVGQVVRADELVTDAPDDEWHEAAPEDLAFLQFSSGSTGAPKGVELTHQNVLSNLSQLATATGLNPLDVVVSWMPYTHDMGLVGTHLAPLFTGATQVRLDPLEFVAAPEIWFAAAHRHRATILCTANFALGLSVKKVTDVARFDLSSVRILANGGEPVSPRACRAFNDHFATARLDPRAMVPMYGLAEATLGVAIPPVGEGLRSRVVAREAFEREGRIELVDAPVDPALHLELVDVGLPLEGVEARIVDDAGSPLPPLRAGNLEIRGPNVSRGYFGIPRHSEWLATGDRAFFADGRLCVTGRAKDVIIVRGRKLLAHDIEAVVETVPGVRAGKACACGFYDAASGDERAILFIAGATDPDAVARRVRGVLGIDLDRVIVLPADAFPKTTSGKLQRYKMRDAFLAGELTPARSERAVSRDVAIIAMSCRFPGASTPEAFFEALLAGHDAVREVPPERFAVDTYYPSRTPSKWGGFLDDVFAFDAAFFGIDDEEAAALDPQHRLLLELSYEALERGGYRRGGRVGVFVGAGSNEYGDRIVDRALSGGDVHPASAIGNLRNLIAARVAHVLDLHGPAMVVDTACSSSLVALHLAREALSRGECDAALVGGVSLNLTAAPYVLLGRAGALSPRGRCHAFSEDADGFVPGEGAGVVMVKRLADAQRDGDPILAIVRGTAINNDGRSISPMAPSVDGQARAIAAAWRDAELEPSTGSYVEAHGTGTPIGDPVEARSIARVMKRPVLIGSAKTNVGHLLAASGMVSLIKVVAALMEQRLPPSLHCTRPREDLGALTVVREVTRWEAPQRAGINAFGFGGTNAHVVLESGPQVELPAAASEVELVVFSAATPDALQQRLVVREASLADIAADAASREPLAHRAAVIATSLDDLRKPPRIVGVAGRRAPRVAFVFAGQGAQYAGQGRVLYQSSDRFRAHFDRCAAAVRRFDGPDLIAASFEQSDDALRETRVAQPLLCAFEIALARTLADVGAAPSVVVGHSVGELAAAAIAGILDDETALRIACVRGQVMDSLRERGRMASVFAPLDVVEAHVARHSDASIAAVNARHQVVVAGSDSAVTSILDALEQDGFAATPLNVSHAFHSPLMRPLRDALRSAIGVVAPRAPATPMISTVTGELVGQLDATYWIDHAERRVEFARAILRTDADIFLEIGPRAALAAALRAMVEDRPVFSALRRGDNDQRALLTTLAQLWVRGVPVDVRSLTPPRRRAVLPTYPFARTRHWLEVENGAVAMDAPLLRRRLALGLDSAAYEARFEPRSPLVADHVVLGTHVVPAAACWELVLEAARDALGRAPGGLASATFRRPLDVQESPRTVTVTLERRGALHWTIRDGDEVLGEGLVAEEIPRADRVDLAAIQARCAARFDPRELYRRLTDHGMHHGPHFQRVEELWVGEAEILARLRAGAPATHLLDPALGDAAVQGIAALLMERGLGRDVLYVPFSVDLLSIFRPVTAACYAHLQLVKFDRELLECDVRICDASGEVLSTIAGLSLKRARALPLAEPRVNRLMRTVTWEAIPRQAAELPDTVAILGGGDVAASLATLLGERGVRVDPSAERVVDLRGLGSVPPIPSELLRARPGWVVTGDTRRDPSRAAWNAFARALSEERREVRAIEIRDGDPAAMLVEELACEKPGSVLLDGGKRLGPVLRPQTVVGATRYRNRGTYVVTGGSSGIGLALARDLRARFDAHVVIFGRRTTPPDVDAVYRQVDMSDPQAVGRALADVGPIDGIFHCAGVIRPGLVRDKTLADLEETFAAKVTGAEALVANAKDVGFIALFSSVSAALPRFAGGLADYAAANAALDAIAARVGPPVISIGWGAWGETGMGASDERRALAARVGLRPLGTEEGLRACERAIASGLSHLVALDEAEVPTDVSPAPAVEGELVDVVRDLVARATSLPPSEIGLDDSLLSLGLESLSAVEIVKTLERRLARRLPTTLLFEHPTLRRAVAALQASPTADRPPTTADDQTSPTQRAILVGEELNPSLPPYSYLRVGLAHPLDRAALARALPAVLARHPSLRAVFPDRDRAIVHSTASLAVEDVEDAAVFRRTPFDRTRAPLLRIGVADRELHLCGHHAVADAWSLAIVARDLLTVYGGRALSPLRATPAALRVERREEDVAYFRDRLRDLPPTPMLLAESLDGPARTVETRIGRDTTTLLRRRASALGVSLFHLLVAVHVRFLAQETAQRDVLLHIAHARRDAQSPDAGDVVGGFADVVPLRVDDAELEVLAPAVRDAVIGALAHGTVSSLDLAPLLRGVRVPSLSFASFPSMRDVETADVSGSTAGPTTALGAAAWEVNGELGFAWTSGLAACPLDELAERHRRRLEEAAASVISTTDLVHARFVARAAETPNAEAVADADGAVSYERLERESRAIARALVGARVVGIRIEPGVDAITAILGALRAGAAYLPLDPGFPAARLHVMQREADRVLTASEVRRIVATDDGSPLTPVTVEPSSAAYVLFTSGSSGTPKRVAVSHEGLASFLDATQRRFELTSSDRCLQTASLCFDASVRQIFAPLMAGATVICPGRALLLEPEELARWIERERVTVWGSVPSLFGRLVNALERQRRRLSLRWVILGGEPLRAALVRRFFDVHPRARVANVYGPTETTVNVTCHVVSTRPPDDAVDIPIGRSIGTAEVFLEDGQIVVRGGAVSLGLGGVYRTGDYARANEDGSLTFLGRHDRQTKLRGYRIELAEIENALLAQPGVARAVVALDGERLTATVEGPIESSVVRSGLDALLPQYMIPHEIVVADAIPSTPTGKVAQPLEPKQAAVARAFAAALKLTDVGADDDFFALGGDSILALEVFVRLREELGYAPRAIEIFRSRTPRALALAMADEASRPEPTTTLSPVQAGFFIAHRLSPETPTNWCAALAIEGDLDAARLRAALAVVAARHPMIGASFHAEDGRARQRIDEVTIPLEIVDGDRVAEIVARERAHVFDLSRAPLVRLCLVRVEPQRHVLIATAHHIIGDAWSGRVFASDLFAAYDGRALPPVRAGFGALRSNAASLSHFRRMFGTPYVPPELRRHDAPGTAVGRATLTSLPDDATLATRLFAAWVRRARAIAARTDLVIGVATTGREAETVDAFGPFAHAVPVRVTDDDTDEALRLSLAHADAPLSEIAALAPRVPGSTISAIAQIFFTFVDADSMPPIRSSELRIRVERAESALTETATELLFAAVKEGGRLEARIEAPSGVASEAELARHARAVVEELIPPDAALISYLPAPRDIAALTGIELPREQIRARVFPAGLPRVVERVATRMGSSATILIPRFADELSKEGLADEIARAAHVAKRAGARVVSLAGMLPSHTAYGAALESNVRLTTGHAATVVAVTKTLERAMQRMSVDPGRARVAFLGVGSIGQSTLELMLSVLPQPRAIGLFDLPRTHERLRALTGRWPYSGDVEIGAPEAAADYDVIVGATSVAGVLDVARLGAGTIVVDDSFPPCFDHAAARARMVAGEILAVSGGTLDCGEIRRHLVDVPTELEDHLRALSPSTMAGCQLESILIANDSTLSPTIGLVDADSARHLWSVITAMGVAAAPLRLGGWVIDDATLDRVAARNPPSSTCAVETS